MKRITIKAPCPQCNSPTAEHTFAREFGEGVVVTQECAACGYFNVAEISEEQATMLDAVAFGDSRH